MRYHKACVILFGVILNASQTYGVLEINLPPNKVGYYKETTFLNCTDTPFIVANGYSWSKGPGIIYDSVTGDATGTGKYESSHGTGFFTLEIKDTKLDDKGDYKCSYNFHEADDALEIHAKGSGQGKVEGDKLVITLNEFYPNTTTVSSVICNGKTFTGTSEVTDAGDFFNLVWTSDTSVDTSDLKNDCKVSMSSISPYVIMIAVDIGPDPDCFDLTILVICMIIICVVGLGMKIVAIICYIIKKIKEKKTFLILEVAVIVLFIICIGIGISVLTDKDKDHCPWQKKCAQAFEGIAVSLVIIDVIIMVLVYFDKIKPIKKGCNAFNCFNGGNDGGNNGGRGHGGGHGTNSNTVHSRREDTHRGTLSDRANSDGEVSRKDVHVQENRDNFSGRPMPPIPLTDKKGRGLSANYDDDHPMITVGIPDKRAGDLGPLAEEPKKKKKKKKKQVNDDDV